MTFYGTENEIWAFFGQLAILKTMLLKPFVVYRKLSFNLVYRLSNGFDTKIRILMMN